MFPVTGQDPRHNTRQIVCQIECQVGMPAIVSDGNDIPVVPHKAVAEVSKIGNL